MRRRVDIEADHVAQLGGEGRVRGELERPNSVRLQPVRRPRPRCTEAGEIPTARAIARTVQWVAWPGGAASVRATTRSTRSTASRGMREGRVRSAPNLPSTPASRYMLACQRQTLGLALPVRRMISTVPSRSAERRTMLARQTCFCGLFRSVATAAKRARSPAESQRQQGSRMTQP